ncbi:MAG: RNA polymerase sigma factor [Caldisericaceae bacterium]
MDEKELIRRLKRGDASAQEAFIRKYQDLIYGAIFQIARDADLSKDVLQEVFIKALKNINKFNEDAEISTWLYRIAMNTLNDELRQLNKVHPLTDDSPKTIDSPIYSFDEKKKIIFEGMGKLDENYREILSLVDIQGLSYEEASMLTGVPIGTVRSRLARAREKLRDIILDSNFFDKI